MLYNLNVDFAPSMIGDILVIVVILVFGIIASSKGFFRCIVGFVGTVLSILFAFLFCKAMASSLQNWFGLLDTLTGWFTSLFMKIDAFAVPIQNNVESSLTAAQVPAFIISLIVSALNGSDVAVGTTTAQLIAPIVANMILLVISFLIIFTVIKVLCFILNKTVGKLMTTVPVVKSINALLGFAIGIFEGLFVVYGILFVLAIFPIQAVTDYFASTTVLNYLYQNNMIGYLVSWIVSSDWLKDTLINLQVFSNKA